MPTDTHATPGTAAPGHGGWTPPPPAAPGGPPPAAVRAASTTRRRPRPPGMASGPAAPGRAVRRPPSASPTPRTPDATAEVRRRRARARALRLAVARHRPLVLLLCAVAAVMGTARALTPPPASTRPVTVAAHDLGAGHVLAAGDLLTVDWPADLSPPPSDASAVALAGRTLTAAVRAGEPVTDARLLGPGTLAGQPPGTLAVPVRLADPATAGIVSPGDHVDVIAGTAVDVPGLESGPAEADVVAWDVVVLATPGRDDAATGESGGGLGALTGGSGDEPADGGGLLVVATDRATAVRLARAQAGRILSVTVRGSPGGGPPP
jgi:pilus assembly protein CpaB